MYLAGTYWLYHSIHGIGKAPIWLTLFVMLAMVAILSAYTAFVGYALARWFPASVLSPAAKTGAAAGTVSSNAPLAIRYLLILPAAWVLLEWFRGWFLSGFPWLALGYSHLDTPLAGLAPVGGVYTLSLAVAMCAGAAALLVIGSTRTRMVAVSAILALWTIGFVLTKPVWTHPSGSPMTVAIVQGAVPQDEKWTTDPAATIRLYHELTAPHLGADVIVWPESALPVLAHEAMQILDPLVRIAHERGSRLVTGLVRYDFDRDEYYNGLVAIDDEPQWYYKRRLVPFGEFFPVPSFVREWLKLMNLPYSDLTAGEARSACAQGEESEDRRDDLLRGRVRVRTTRRAEGRNAARQRHERCVVRRLHRRASASADQPHARARSRASAAAGRERRRLCNHRGRRGSGEHTAAISAGRAHGRRAAAHRADALCARRQ